MLDEETREHGAVLQPLRDADEDIRPEVVAAVAQAVAAGDRVQLAAIFGDRHAADQGDLLGTLDPPDQARLITLLGVAFDFRALTELDETARIRLVRDLPKDTLVQGLSALDSDDAVYILEDLDRDDQLELLRRLPVHDRVTLARSLDYPEESAGRRMQTDVVAVPEFWTVGRTIDHFQDAAELPERFYEIFVVDPRYRLRGAVPLDVILRSKCDVAIADIVSQEWHRVRATEDQEDVARRFEHYNWVSAPVVDDDGRLVGVITVDDVVDVIEEEADEDLKALGGVKADEELSDSVWAIARSRFSWLFVNLLTAILASAVISLFEGQIERMVALAVLMPIVASQGGNAGTQTMTVAVRALATRELGHANALRIVRREVFAGLLNGAAFAVIMGAVAIAWFGVPDLGIVVGIAMIIVLVAAALGGILIPLALDRLGVDPAVSSGPFVTTVTDVVGFFAFLGVATLWFHQG